MPKTTRAKTRLIFANTILSNQFEVEFQDLSGIKTAINVDLETCTTEEFIFAFEKYVGKLKGFVSHDYERLL